MVKRTIFTESNYYTGPDLTDDMVAEAEARLGYRLPKSYLQLLRIRNGGVPERCCFKTTFATSWAHDHIKIDAILGIGGPWGIDAGPQSSAEMITEWGYPAIGIVICDLPSGGHDTVMLDYSQHDPEPQVVYIDEDRSPRVLAPSFAQFLEGLIECG